MGISAMSFSIMDILVKLMSVTYPTGELVFFRGFFGLIPIFLLYQERDTKIYSKQQN